MKKLAIILIVTILCVSCLVTLTACNSEGKIGDVTKINVLVPDGAPALTIAKLIKEKPAFDGYEITYTVVTGGATDVSAKMISGEGNMAIIPTNLASVLYNKVGAKMIATNVQGLLYLVGKNDVQSLEELKGQVVYNIGQGATPDLTFKYILSKAGVEYVESDTAVDGKVALTYVSSGAELIPLLKQGKAAYGILGEPAVTKACNAAGVKVQFDIQKLWQSATESETYGYPQTSLIVGKDLQTEEITAFLSWFVGKIAESDNWLEDNAGEAGQILEGCGSQTLNGTLSGEMVKKCNIKTICALDAKDSVNTYLTVLGGFNAASIGGKVPSDDFYFEVR